MLIGCSTRNWLPSYLLFTLAYWSAGTSVCIQFFWLRSISLTCVALLRTSEMSILSTWPLGTSGIALPLLFAHCGLRT